MNVISVRGGKVHSMMPGMDAHPYPLCRGGGVNQSLTKFTVTAAELTCKTCLTYKERRKLREEIEEAHDIALFMHEMWEEKQAHLETTKFERAYDKAADATDCERCLTDAQINADDTAAEEGFAAYSERWYEIATLGIGATHDIHVAQDAADAADDAARAKETSEASAERRNKLQEWFDKGSRSFCVIGKGKAPHLTLRNDESLCGRTFGADGSRYISVADAQDMSAPCGTCWKIMEREVDEMTEAKPTSAAATRHVRRNMDRETRPMHHAWESFSLESLERFTTDAKRWLGDATELSSRTIDSADYEAIYAELSNYNDTESDETMPPKKKAAEPAKVDVTTEDGKKFLAEIDGGIERLASLTAAGDSAAEPLGTELENWISSLSGKGVAGIKSSKRKELRAAKETPAAETAPAVSTYADFEGAKDRVSHATDIAREAVEAGKDAGSLAIKVSEAMLGIRLTIPNPKTGLPDLMSASQYTKNAAADVYAEVQRGISEGDEIRTASYNALKYSVNNRMPTTLIGWLRGLDQFPSDPDSQSGRVELLRQHFPSIADTIAADPNASATEAVYALYADKGVELPRKDKAEIARDRRAAEKVLVLRAELEAAREEGEDDKAAELESKLQDATDRVPAELLAPKAEEKTPQQRQFERIDRQQEALKKALKNRPRTADERRDLAARLESLSGWLTAEIVSLREGA